MSTSRDGAPRQTRRAAFDICLPLMAVVTCPEQRRSPRRYSCSWQSSEQSYLIGSGPARTHAPKMTVGFRYC
eukprot:1743366-Amphidinium_carterae.2